MKIFSSFEEATSNKLGSNKFKILFIVSIVLLIIAIIAAAVVGCYYSEEKQRSESYRRQLEAESGSSNLGIRSASLLHTAFKGSTNSIYQKAAVAADNGRCSEIGRNIMEQGGNAVDAIVAVDLCIGIADPHSSGLGGGFFLTIYNSTEKRCYVLDAREMAPLKATADMYVSNPISSTIGGLAIAVPGDLAGLWEAHSRFGKLSWKTVLDPTINLCTEGMPVSGALRKAIKRYENEVDTYPTMKPIWINPKTGQSYKEGEIMKRPQLAATLQNLANSKNPRELFYKGEIAKNLANDINNEGGIIGTDDLAQYEPRWRNNPVIASYPSKGITLCGPPPPSSAAVVADIVGIMSLFDLSAEKLMSSDDQILFYYRLIESMKFGYAHRSELGDQSFVTGAKKIAKKLTNNTTWREQNRAILNKAQTRDYYGGKYLLNDAGTSHMNAIDGDGNAAALTSTINYYFGAKVFSNSTGIILNNEMDDFSTPGVTNLFGYAPSKSNFIVPRKRPMSSMSPVVVWNDKGEVVLSTGAAGGSKIISTTVQIVLRNLWLNQSISTSLEASRIHDQLYPPETKYEAGFPQEFINDLVNKYGEKMVDSTSTMAAATGIARNSMGFLTAASDSRKPGGYPAGY